MPEPVYMWTKERSVELVDRALSGIIGSYEKDFGKHLSFDENVAKYDVQKITLIWNSLPAQLSNEKKKFTYSKVREGEGVRKQSAMACQRRYREKGYKNLKARVADFGVRGRGIFQNLSLGRGAFEESV